MPRKFSNGLFIGRFQPLHKGHMKALLVALSMCDKVVIGVGSAQESGTEINPLSAMDRIRIIRSAIKGPAFQRRVRFLMIPDFNDNDKWFSYIIRNDPGIDVVFSQTKLVKRIFRDHGIRVISPKWYDRRRLSATKIRNIIKKGRRWHDRVPKAAIPEISAMEQEIKESKGSVITKRK